MFNGRATRTGGTSMAAPLVASIFNLLNEERLAAGKSLIGFANPAIYKNPSTFTDIVNGGMATDMTGACNGKTFKATPGWDPASGLGTPIYTEMSKYFGSL